MENIFKKRLKNITVKEKQKLEVSSLLSLLLLWVFLLDSGLGGDYLVLLWNWESLSVSGELEELSSGLTASVSIWMLGHVGTGSVWRLLLQSLDLSGGIVNLEVLEESLWSLLVLMLDLLWGGMDLLLSLSLTTFEAHVDGALSLVLDSAIDKELLVLECLDTVLEVKVHGIAIDGSGNLFPKNMMVRKWLQ